MLLKKRDFIVKLTGLIFIFMFMQINIAYSEDNSDVKRLMKEIESLKERIKQNELAIQRTADVNEINNLINKFFYRDEATMYDEMMNYIAKKTPGVSIEVTGRGVFKGYDGAKRTLVDTEKYYLAQHASGMKKTYPDLEFDDEADGFLALWHTASPVIVVAGDGKTAKGVWSSLYLTSKTYDMVQEPQAKWFWYKIAVDFVKEDGEWKIWHYYRQPRFGIQSYYASLAGGPPGSASKTASSASGAGDSASGANASAAHTAPVNPNEGKTIDGHPMDSHGTYADGPSSKAYRSGYSLTNAPHYWPEPPESYQTFDDDSAYVYPSLSGQQPSPPKR